MITELRRPLLLIFLTFLLCHFHLFAQSKKVEFIGKVTDSLGNNLYGANILLLDTTESVPPSFGATDINGAFKIQIHSNTNYRLKISFLGYLSIEKKIEVANEGIQEHFEMSEAPNKLQEVVLKYKPALKIKKDTLIYQADSFATGKERKLKELLNKLPGVEVTREGTVFVGNKKVTKVLVEGNNFFDGTTKMAVKNIPADVIEEIQIIDDYQKTAFLKDFVESDDMAMNLILKEDKKKFIFGDLETGINSNKNYRLHPSLFKYGPKFLSNFIADFNNTPERSFTLRDYLSFEGDLTPEEFREKLASPVVNFLNQNEFYKNKHSFSGLNNQFNPNGNNEFRVFMIWLKDDYSLQQDNLRNYLTNQNSESRQVQNNSINQVLSTKFQYKYSPKNDFELLFTTDITKVNNKLDEYNSTQTNLEPESIYTKNGESNDKNLTLNLEVSKKFSSSNSAIGEISYKKHRYDLQQKWKSDINIFHDTLNLISSNPYAVQNKDLNNSDIVNFEIKDMMRPYRTGLITFLTKGNIQNHTFSSLAYQSFDTETNNLPDFFNDFSSAFGQLSTGLGYKQIFGKVNVELNLEYQYLYWIDKMGLTRNVYDDDGILPSLKVKWAKNDKLELSLLYMRHWYTPSIFQRFQGLRLEDFNTISLGNEELTHSLSDNYLLNLIYFKPYGLSFFGTIRYGQNKDQIINRFSYNGINGFIQTANINKGGQRYGASARFNYGHPYWKISLDNRFNYNETPTSYNSFLNINRSWAIVNGLRMKTLFENFPNFEFNFENQITTNRNDSFSNKTNLFQMDISSEWNFNNWKFNVLYDNTNYNNLSNRNNSNYNNIEASIFYRKEDSPWEFGINGYNLGNSKQIITNSSSSQIFLETTRRQFPRTIMFNINYKF